MKIIDLAEALANVFDENDSPEQTAEKLNAYVFSEEEDIYTNAISDEEMAEIIEREQLEAALDEAVDGHISYSEVLEKLRNLMEVDLYD